MQANDVANVVTNDVTNIDEYVTKLVEKEDKNITRSSVNATITQGGSYGSSLNVLKQTSVKRTFIPIDVMYQKDCESTFEVVNPINTPKPTSKTKKISFTVKEDIAIVEGINKHGIGNWKKIVEDKDLADVFNSVKQRTNTNIKDRWRTLVNNSLVEQNDNVWILKN